MPWAHYIGCFFGGVFLANSLPHLIAGVSGQPMQSPFASPPFRGLSSPTVNVAWALVNLAIAYGMLERITSFDLHKSSDALASFFGFGAMALLCSRSFSRLRQEGENRG